MPQSRDSIRGGTRSLDPLPDSDSEYNASCAKIEMAMSRLDEMELGSPRAKKTNHNPYDALTVEGDSEGSEEEKASSGSGESEEEDSDYREEDGGDGGGFTVVKRHGLLVNQRMYSERMCRFFSDCFNAYFKIMTGKDLHFVITPASQPFVSAFESCIARDHLLSTLFCERPVYCDPMCGSGSDACSALFNLFPDKVMLCEFVQDHYGEVIRNGYTIMEQNVNNMRLLFEELHGAGAPAVTYKNMNCIDFILAMEEHAKIDIMNLDPNWSEYGAKYERTPEEMAEHLKVHIFDPLKARKITPKCFVFKTRWGADTLLPYIRSINKGYYAMYSVEATPFRDRVKVKTFSKTKEARGVFHWVIFVHNELENMAWSRSQVYTDVFIEGKDVKVLRSDEMVPLKPVYASNPRFPKKREIEPGDDFFVVHVPKLRKKTRPEDRGEKRPEHTKNKKATHPKGKSKRITQPHK